MADIAELIVNACTGLGGAVIGAVATFLSANGAHKRAQVAADAEAARKVREDHKARAWQLMHSANNNYSVLSSVQIQIEDQIRAFDDLPDQEIWRALPAGSVTTPIEPITADQLAVLLPLSQAGLARELLNLNANVLALREKFVAYSAIRSELQRLEGGSIVSGIATEELIAKNPAFMGLINISVAMRTEAYQGREQGYKALKRLMEVLEPMLKELGVRSMKLAPFPECGVPQAAD